MHVKVGLSVSQVRRRKQFENIREKGAEGSIREVERREPVENGIKESFVAFISQRILLG